ncbi:MAG: single-stranded-DNA-specific exonuclease RecJ [Anaerolineales bacterium]|nr:single-stranded-DNA-specific exonuclease RecJ [Anaerolineales bacterium]
MAEQKTRWQLSPKIPDTVSEELSNFSRIFRQILYNREITTRQQADQFLHAGFPPHADSQLLGTREAVDRIGQALKDQEKIAVYGDYDADGVTATALMLHTLNALGAEVRSYIPNRFTEGYGLNITALEKLKTDGVSLVITVDCGIRAVQQAEHAASIGLELIITDHHTPGTDLPRALTIINPKQPDDPYPEKVLAGVGVAYKLAKALIERFNPPSLVAEDLLDLVAIGTVADLVPLVGENRALVREGLRYIRTPRRQGILSLLGVIGLPPTNVTAATIGFGIGPRINAAGRIGSAQDALNLLMARDIPTAAEYAQVLDNRNRERQRITREIQIQSEALAEIEQPGTYLLFSYHPDFNPGVVGLAASKLVEEYYRPAVVGFLGEGFTRASCRSIPEFHITHALDECSDLLEQYGGHAGAAGFTVLNKNLDQLAYRLQTIAREQLQSVDLAPSIIADAAVRLPELTPALLKEIDLLEPTGQLNESPLFVSYKVDVRGARTVGKDKSHLKLILSQDGMTFDAIAFRFGHLVDEVPGQIDILYAFEMNEFNGQQTLQLNIKDLKFAW